MEVIYHGAEADSGADVSAAIQEDVDVVALSILSGAHKHLFPRVVELLRERGADDVLVFGGGVIPEEDIPFLKSKGIAEIFGPGTPTSKTIEFIRANLKRPLN
jgi:methylmalonyl-CoA mutase C-terminal domain/subunit